MVRYPRHGLEADSGAKLPALNVSDRGHAQSPQTQETQGTSESQAHCHVAATSQMAETGTKAQGAQETDLFIFRSRVVVCIILERPGRMLTHMVFRSSILKLKVRTLWSLRLAKSIVSRQ